MKHFACNIDNHTNNMRRGGSNLVRSEVNYFCNDLLTERKK